MASVDISVTPQPASRASRRRLWAAFRGAQLLRQIRVNFQRGAHPGEVIFCKFPSIGVGGDTGLYGRFLTVHGSDFVEGPAAYVN